MAQPFTAAMTGLVDGHSGWVMPAKPESGRLPRAAACRLVFQVVASGERLVARPGDDGDPLLRIVAEGREHLVELPMRRRVQGVVDLRPVDRDDGERAFALDL